MLLGMFVGTVGAETYTWVDSNGTVNFTEDISNVPKKYLGKVRVRGEVEPASSGATENTAESVSATPVPTKTSEEPAEQKPALYGGRSGKSWKADFSTLRAEIGSTDDQIAELNSRLSDTSKMSRGDYLGIMSSIKNFQFHRGVLEKKLKSLDEQASRAGVPGEFR